MTVRDFFLVVLACLGVAILVLWRQSDDLLVTLGATVSATLAESGSSVSPV